MAAKRIAKQFTVIVPAADANPKPPLGPMLWQNGINIGWFIKEFNDKSAEIARLYGKVRVPCKVMVYIDKTYDIEILPPVTSGLILWKAKIPKGSATPNKETLATITMKDIEDIAVIKMPVMNTENMDSIKKSIIGTAKNMGIKVA